MAENKQSQKAAWRLALKTWLLNLFFKNSPEELEQGLPKNPYPNRQILPGFQQLPERFVPPNAPHIYKMKKGLQVLTVNEVIFTQYSRVLLPPKEMGE